MPSALSLPAAVHAQSDLEMLQGVWISIAGRREARLTISGDRFVFAFRDGEIYSGNYLLDSNAEPRHMDMRIEEGPAKYLGQLALCIYRLESDLLRWCPTRPGSGFRLTSFPSVDDERFLSLVFKPERPPRQH